MIQLHDIGFGYPGRSPLFEGLRFQLFRGDRVGLTGPNGSGKTTLFHLIMGLVKPCSGGVEIFGRFLQKERDFRPVRQRIGLLFQEADDQLFCPTVLEDVAFGPLNKGKSPREARDLTREILGRLGLAGFENRITHQLSGGEKRMVSLAAVLAMEPEILLLDEPTSGLDDRKRGKFKEVLLDLDLTYMLISHERDFLAQTTRTLYAIERGKMVRVHSRE